MSRAVWMIAALHLTTANIVAQEVWPRDVRVGDRVRATLASRIAPAPLIGTVVAVSPDSLVVEREEGGQRTLTPRQVESLEISVERRMEPGKAAGYGILATAPLLAPALVFAMFSPYGGYVLWVTLPFVAGAAVVGALLGGGAQDVWVEATWPPAPPADPFPTAPSDTTGG